MDVFCAVLLCLHLFTTIQASGDHQSLRVSASHRTYECPEGADVTLTCLPSGPKAYQDDRTWTTWLFTSRSQDHCQKGLHPRKANHTSHALGVEYFNGDKSFSVSLKNIKHRDQGKYCCWILDFHGKHKEQEAHDFMYLTVVPTPPEASNGSLKCSEYSHSMASDDSVAEGLAIAACVAFILCLPLILMLVYRQRQTVQRHRRAHELVRMDSEAQAHENPVFLGDSPQFQPLTISKIMRQSSETGHHLLSDQGTPFSTNIQGEQFFPAQDPIPESSDLLG